MAALSANVLSKVRKNDSRQLRQCSGGRFAKEDNDDFSGSGTRTDVWEIALPYSRLVSDCPAFLQFFLDMVPELRYTTTCKVIFFTGGVFMEKSLTELDEIVELSYLYDFYGALLKENHRLIFEDYVLNDLSLAEIAREREITRQGVYDIIRRCRIRLRDYEEKLQLVHKFQMTKDKLQEIERIVREETEGETTGRITRLAQEIYDII